MEMSPQNGPKIANPLQTTPVSLLTFKPERKKPIFHQEDGREIAGESFQLKTQWISNVPCSGVSSEEGPAKMA
jgi:hypothetical protein